MDQFLYGKMYLLQQKKTKKQEKSIWKKRVNYLLWGAVRNCELLVATEIMGKFHNSWTKISYLSIQFYLCTFKRVMNNGDYTALW